MQTRSEAGHYKFSKGMKNVLIGRQINCTEGSYHRSKQTKYLRFWVAQIVGSINYYPVSITLELSFIQVT